MARALCFALLVVTCWSPQVAATDLVPLPIDPISVELKATVSGGTNGSVGPLFGVSSVGFVDHVHSTGVVSASVDVLESEMLITFSATGGPWPAGTFGTNIRVFFGR